MSNLAALQKDMRQGYLWGATGIIVSGLVWLAAALVAYSYGPTRAIWTLFIGAAFIHPLSIVIGRVLGAAGKHSAGNGLARLAMESTVSMIMCLTLAYGLSLPPHASAFLGAAIEIAFGTALLVVKRGSA